MKFLVDAHLPKRLVRQLRAAGHDVVHTADLPSGNRTTDAELNRLSVAEERILVTKDGDFVDSHLVSGQPYKLLLVSTGNIANPELLELLTHNLDRLVAAFAEHSYVELDRAHVTIHL